MSYAASDLPRRHRLTVTDYYRMAEVGILAPDTRVDLIEGEIIDTAPPDSLHAATVHRLNELLIRQGEYTLVDEPDLRAALDVVALGRVTVDLKGLLG
jgi:hypothetical protein